MVAHAQLNESKCVLAIARPRVYSQIREIPFDHLRRAHRSLHVVDRKHEHFSMLRMRGTQQFQPRGVAVKYLDAEAPQKIYMSLIRFERRKGDFLRAQDAADDLPETAKARDDDSRVQFDGFVEGTAVGFLRLEERIVQR